MFAIDQRGTNVREDAFHVERVDSGAWILRAFIPDPFSAGVTWYRDTILTVEDASRVDHIEVPKNKQHQLMLTRGKKSSVVCFEITFDASLVYQKMHVRPEFATLNAAFSFDEKSLFFDGLKRNRASKQVVEYLSDAYSFAKLVHAWQCNGNMPLTVNQQEKALQYKHEGNVGMFIVERLIAMLSYAVSRFAEARDIQLIYHNQVAMRGRRDGLPEKVSFLELVEGDHSVTVFPISYGLESKGYVRDGVPAFAAVSSPLRKRVHAFNLYQVLCSVKGETSFFTDEEAQHLAEQLNWTESGKRKSKHISTTFLSGKSFENTAISFEDWKEFLSSMERGLVPLTKRALKPLFQYPTEYSCEPLLRFFFAKGMGRKLQESFRHTAIQALIYKLDAHPQSLQAYEAMQKQGKMRLHVYYGVGFHAKVLCVAQTDVDTLMTVYSSMDTEERARRHAVIELLHKILLPPYEQRELRVRRSLIEKME